MSNRSYLIVSGIVGLLLLVVAGIALYNNRVEQFPADRIPNECDTTIMSGDEAVRKGLVPDYLPPLPPHTVFCKRDNATSPVVTFMTKLSTEQVRDYYMDVFKNRGCSIEYKQNMRLHDVYYLTLVCSTYEGSVVFGLPDPGEENYYIIGIRPVEAATATVIPK